MKNSEQNDLEKLLKDNLSGKTAGVPDFVWDRIEAEIYPKKKRRGFFWLFFGIGLLITGISAACVLFSREAGTRTQTLSQHTVPATGKRASDDERAAVHSGKPVDLASETTGKKATGLTIFTEPVEMVSGLQKQGRTKQASGKALPAGKSSGKAETGQPATEIKTNLFTPETSAVLPPITNPVSTVKNPNAPLAATEPDTVTQPADSTVAAADTVSTAAVSTADEPEKPAAADKKFSVGLYGGASLYDIAVFKDYFTSGQLSNRTFQSGGFEAGVDFSYRFAKRFTVYGGAAFNRKTTSFRYNLAITEADYFTIVLPGNLLSIEKITDDGIGNCFLAENVTARYQVDSWLLSLGTTYKILTWKKLSLGLDLRLSANLYSGLKMQELTVIQVGDYAAEHFNYIRPGAGLTLDYQLNPRFSVGLAPMYSVQLNKDSDSFYVGNVKELVIPARVRFYF